MQAWQILEARTYAQYAIELSVSVSTSSEHDTDHARIVQTSAGENQPARNS
jgi:hypothetical protein